MLALWVVRSILGGPLNIRVNFKLLLAYGFQDVFLLWITHYCVGN